MREKLKESLLAVLPVYIIVVMLGLTIVPMTLPMIYLFSFGSLLLILGIAFFSLGAQTSMMLVGEKIGKTIAKTKKVFLIIFACLLVGVFITIAEPDLRVLANEVPIVGNLTLILSVSFGVGVFLVIAFLRIFYQVRLSVLLTVFYIIAFALALSPLIPNNFIPVAFDSGGVTTGPITVPFIMALGLGIASIRGDKTSEDDTFGLVALCSIGPILTVLILGAITGNASISGISSSIIDVSSFSQIISAFFHASFEYFKEVALALLPILLIIIAFHFAVKMKKREVRQVIFGFLLTYVGLALFLTGVNVGFMPIGRYIGEYLAGGNLKLLLIPLGSLIGYFIVRAEPAVGVLTKQVEDITDGHIKSKTLSTALNIAICISVGLAMIRVITGINIIWFLIPGYIFSLAMTKFVPQIFTAIAFDSGGVASGPMTATFLLPLTIGATIGMGGDVSQNAFGTVAMVAMTPLITIQLLGLKDRLTKQDKLIDLSELDEVIEVWEVA